MKNFKDFRRKEDRGGDGRSRFIGLGFRNTKQAEEIELDFMDEKNDRRY